MRKAVRKGPTMARSRSRGATAAECGGCAQSTNHERGWQATRRSASCRFDSGGSGYLPSVPMKMRQRGLTNGYAPCAAVGMSRNLCITVRLHFPKGAQVCFLTQELCSSTCQGDLVYLRGACHLLLPAGWTGRFFQALLNHSVFYNIPSIYTSPNSSTTQPHPRPQQS